jgi:hypothetical protein
MKLPDSPQYASAASHGLKRPCATIFGAPDVCPGAATALRGVDGRAGRPHEAR